MQLATLFTGKQEENNEVENLSNYLMGGSSRMGGGGVELVCITRVQNINFMIYAILVIYITVVKLCTTAYGFKVHYFPLCNLG